MCVMELIQTVCKLYLLKVTNKLYVKKFIESNVKNVYLLKIVSKLFSKSTEKCTSHRKI